MLLYQYKTVYLFYMNANLLNNKLYIYVITKSTSTFLNFTKQLHQDLIIGNKQ